MKKFLMVVFLLALVGCGKNETVNTPDYKGDIDSNAARIELLELNDSLQDLRLDALEATTADLETRLSQAEDDIDSNEEDIASLFDSIDDLEDDLSDLRDDLNYEVRQLRRADRQTRRLIRSRVRSLRRQLSREIRQRQIADANLQSQIDDVESDLNSFEARQSLINSFLSRGLAITNFRISQLQFQISRSLNRINNRIDLVQNDIDQINSEITSINSEINLMQNQISDIESSVSDIESSVVSVVYPCGEGNSEEILLKTQDGLVAYFQQTRNETETVEIDQTIPEHFICDRFVGQGNICVRGRNVSSSTATESTTFTHQVLVKAYLDVLDDGNYRTTDGYSCNFTISNGEVQ